MRFIGLLFFLHVAICLKGQTFKQGLEYGNSKEFSPVKLLGFVDGHIAVIRANADQRSGFIKDILVELIDSTTLVKKGEWKFEGLFQDRQQFFPEDIRVWNNQLCLFGSSYDKQRKANTLQVIPVNSKGEMLPRKTLQSSETSHFDFNHHRFEIAGIEGQERLAVISLNESEQQGIPKVHLSLYDKDFNLQKQFSSYLPFQGKDPQISDLLVDQPGNVHLLLKGHKGSDTSESVYSLFAFPVMSDEAIEYQLDIPDKVVSGMKVQLSEDDKLLVGGILRDNFQQSDQVSGIFYLRINRETGLVENKGIHRFDVDFKGLFVGENKISGLEDFSGFKIKECIPSKKGGLILIAEKTDEKEICENDYRTGVEICHKHYYSGKILLVSMNDRGEIDWYQTIEKQQHTQDDDGAYLSFDYFIDNSERLLILYNKSNTENSKTDFEMSDPVKSHFTAIVIESNGQLRELITPVKTPFLPSIYWRNYRNTIFLLGLQKGNSSLLQIDSQ